MYQPTQIRLYRFGNGSTQPYQTRVFVQFANFATDWSAGETLRVEITNNNVTPAITDFWELVIPNNLTSALTITDPIAMHLWPAAPTTHTISGAFTSVNWDLANVSIATNPALAPDAITYNATTGAYSITVPDGWTGRVTPTKAGYIITPEYRDYTGVTANFENQTYSITKNVNPNVPVITYPAAGAVFNWTAAQTVTFTWTAPTAGFAPEYYEVKLNEGAWVNVNNALTWTSAALGDGNYTFQVRGVINTALGKVSTPLKASLSSAYSNVASKGAGDAASVAFEVIVTTEPEPDIPANTPTPVAPGVNITSDVDLNMNTPTPAQNTVVAALPNVTNLNSSVVTVLTGVGNNVTLSFDITTPGTWYGMLYVGGTWIHATPFPLIVPPAGTITFTGVNFNAKGDVIMLLGEGADPTLPVELSAFNAILTAQKFVKLSWTSESETNMLGYRVYRSETDNQAEAISITPIMIEATNTSTTQHYGIEDREVTVGNIYYYWLEAVDYSHSTFYGYRSVDVVGEVVPELPVSSIMGNAYPNPFKANTRTNIAVSVKAGENATVTIYNVLGQVVKSYKVSEGNHTINWDGRDNRGNACGSGIYFYKMSTPSTNQTKKMVIVK